MNQVIGFERYASGNDFIRSWGDLPSGFEEWVMVIASQVSQELEEEVNEFSNRKD